MTKLTNSNWIFLAKILVSATRCAIESERNLEKFQRKGVKNISEFYRSLWHGCKKSRKRKKIKCEV